jgi:hypothetical protein
MKSFISKGLPALLMAAGILTIVSGLIYYLSPITRLRLYGVTLEQPVASAGPANFLLGWHSDVKSWTEHDGRLDTPLPHETTEETSTLSIERLPGTSTENLVLVKPQEWICRVNSASGEKNQVIPLNHPSIAAATVLLDKQWTLLERREGSAWRMGRALQFLIPKFPKGPLRPGSTWKEHLAWTEGIGDWRVGWQADLQWVLKGFETCYGAPCAQLSYEASLEPSLQQEAVWSKGASHNIRFSGQARGEALYNVAEKYVISNTLIYSGTAKIHIPQLSAVPEDLRVGAFSSDDDGDVVLQFNDKIDVRLP